MTAVGAMLALTLFVSSDVPGTARPSQVSAGPAVPVYGYTIVNTYPHDRDAFTQGLQYLNGVLYEGTGLKGRSSVRKV